MTKLLLHIGMEKTGSTTLQRLLAAHRTALGAAGIAYPTVKRGADNHNLLASAYMPADSPLRGRNLSGLGDKAAQQDWLVCMRRALLADVGRASKAIVSAEHLFRLTPPQIAALAADLAAAKVTDCRVLCILRAPASFYLSFSQQEVKGSSRLPSIDMVIPYAERVAAWQHHFDTRFLDFDALRAAPDGLLGATCAEITAYLAPAPPLPADYPPENETLSPEEMQILQDFRRANFPDQDGQLNRDTSRMIRLLALMRDERWQRPRLAPRIAAHITRRHEAEALRLAALTGITFPPPPAAPDEPPLDPSRFTQSADITTNFDSALHRELLSRMAFMLLREPAFRLRLHWRGKPRAKPR